MTEDEKATVRKLVPLSGSAALQGAEEWNIEKLRWESLINSGALPKHIDTPQKAITIARMGEAYGWDPMRSVRNIYVVDGRPEMSAESMLALIREKCPEAEIIPTEMSARRAAATVRRPPMSVAVEVEVTIDQFKHLSAKSNWKNYPGDMLWARLASRVGRRFFSDVTAGAYTTGELSEAQFSVTQVNDTPNRSSVIDDLVSKTEATEVEVVVGPSDAEYADPGPPEDWEPSDA